LAGLLSAPDLSKNGNILFDIGDGFLAVEKIENVDSESEGHVLREAKASKRKFLFDSQVQVHVWIRLSCPSGFRKGEISSKKWNIP
jgi:hypothetical protein